MGLVDRFLDKSIIFSFDRWGYRRHGRDFVSGDLDVRCEGKVCVVSGGNRGIGFEVVRGLALRGARVYMLCRDGERGEEAKKEIEGEYGDADVHVHEVDIASYCAVKDFVEDFSEESLDVLVHNAGLIPKERRLSEEGLELTLATHLAGPYRLTKMLREKLKGGRVIFVSSGGMYAKRLDVELMCSQDGAYDGVSSYAMTKRAQVVLAELLADDLGVLGVDVYSMHPGWVATEGVEHALPRFWKMMKKRLRTPIEGADTVLWLSVAERVRGESGKFWFDRKKVSTHVMGRTREEEDERRRLWELCEGFMAYS